MGKCVNCVHTLTPFCRSSSQLCISEMSHLGFDRRSQHWQQPPYLTLFTVTWLMGRYHNFVLLTDTQVGWMYWRPKGKVLLYKILDLHLCGGQKRDSNGMIMLLYVCWIGKCLLTCQPKQLYITLKCQTLYPCRRVLLTCVTYLQLISSLQFLYTFMNSKSGFDSVGDS